VQEAKTEKQMEIT